MITIDAAESDNRSSLAWLTATFEDARNIQ
jgi:hypothetical protein